jgi:serine/tyrosine/threonine adenylyltransferase
MTIAIPFDNSYARLPPAFFARTRPAPAPRPRLVALNRKLAEELGIDPEALTTEAGLAALSGNAVPDGADPIATAYAGHQFGQFVPTLGDGRAILLGEVVGLDGVRRDLQLKGSGRTPFSRNGDGRAALGPVLREYLVSEAMAALGVPTTRALAAVSTGDTVIRERALPGAVLARVAQSHIRVGTFQFFAARGDVANVRTLADHVIERHYPEASETAEPYRALLEHVVARQGALVARWLLVGFIHGVMNTDNMSVAGETIDYGPCAFLDAYDPAKTFSSIDQWGRYAYGAQPRIAQWNLARLAEALLPLLAPDQEAAAAIASEALAALPRSFEHAYLAGLRAKLGLAGARDEDPALAEDLLARMAANRADFTLTFRGLCAAAEDEAADATVRALFDDPAAFDDWAVRWRARLALDGGLGGSARADAMRRANPALIPRNHLVEAAIAAAVEREDFSAFQRLLDAVTTPFEERPEHAALYGPPPPEDGYRTFCGT